MQAATSLGRRYMFDEAHGSQVARLAGSLFDQLQDLHGLDFLDRRHLLAAAMLHDIGMFVAPKKHHKHSLYLISRSDLPGLSPEEMLVVANIARYHRRSPPRRDHHLFARLAPGDRVKVTQLAAILRLADALDRQHIQAVREGDARIEGLELHLALKGEADMLLERWAVTRKSPLFQDTFGLRVRASTTP